MKPCTLPVGPCLLGSSLSISALLACGSAVSTSATPEEARAMPAASAAGALGSRVVASGASGGTGRAPRPPGLPPPAPDLQLVLHETFDTPFIEPEAWTEDTYGPSSPWHVDDFDEDGAFFLEAGGELFRAGLASFRSFRKSFTYGRDGWLTVELYGRDQDRDGVPESGGRFVSEGGRARLVSKRHHDAAILRSTHPLPPRYRVEVTVSGIRFGGAGPNGWLSPDGSRFNGYDGDEIGDPWRFRTNSPTPLPALTDNGVYFLCITDYARPAPHNNVFIHHHRKVVMDTDNNIPAWSAVWDPLTQRPELDGSHYVSMIFLDGSSFGSPWTGNAFVSFTPAGFERGPVFVDKYLDGEAYTFAVERDGEAYTLAVTGRFHHGGATTYIARRRFRDDPPVWHYNQVPGELGAPPMRQKVTVGSRSFEAWPADVGYPEHFFFGDPHINYYEGTAEFDDVKLFLPARE
ncbi:hypothetical protein [Chondromyces crocatus]|nr:hypothetical protein [Chondromyces crocatus]